MKKRLIPYAGKDAPQPTVADGAALGPRGIAFLRRVRASGGGYVLFNNADREAAGRARMFGYVSEDRLRDDTVHLSDKGAAFLDDLMRAH
jgi:hypothetical protein